MNEYTPLLNCDESQLCPDECMTPRYEIVRVSDGAVVARYNTISSVGKWFARHGRRGWMDHVVRDALIKAFTS